MFAQGQRRTFGFGSSLTPVGKTMLIIYAVVYVAELIGQRWLGIPIFQTLALSAPNSGQFQIWQLMTHPFIHDPGAPIGFLINCLVFYFFAGTIESALGTRGFLQLYIIAALGGAVACLLFGSMVSIGVPCAGMLPSLILERRPESPTSPL